MDINEFKNKIILQLFIFAIPSLWTNAFAQNIPAQNNTKNSEYFLKDFVKLNTDGRWGPLTARKEETNQNTTESDLKDLQALSYLQGYNPASPLKNVILYNKQRAFPGYNLFLSANAPGATLMGMDGTTIHQWRFPYASLPIHQGYYDPNWCRVRLLKNGDLLALIPFGGLLKIDKDSHLIWFTKITCHHDLDIDSNGNIYTFTVKNSKSADSAGIKIDSITILTPDGKIKKEISLYDLFKKYPDQSYINKINEVGRLKNFLDANNGNKIYLVVPGDVFHSNAIQVLDGRWASENPAFKKGNLLISLRYLGVIICVDPQQEKIAWLMDTVFWNRAQHFAKMLDNGNILLFDNLYRPDLSQVVEFKPAANKIIWEYSGQNGRFFSSFLGLCYRLPNGNTLITESTNGHSFEVTPDKKIVWEFYNPHQVDKNRRLIAVIYQMQRIPIDSNLNWLKN